ncbi:hypothetical protein [Bradyrhizobium sp. Leo121]|uniref:hypothetical protein n=1 Tax=Bradyrhizobium sp. Leo121 TaxID=1571195 RepID=UPI001029EA90|nr:hypothetical protein [Bradyrhizobium sp. Leo121]
MAGANWGGVRDRYLDPVNLADPTKPLAGQPGKAMKNYRQELAGWLKTRYGQEDRKAGRGEPRLL